MSVTAPSCVNDGIATLTTREVMSASYVHFKSFWRRSLIHFSNMRDGLVNAQALRESSSATLQGQYIKRLTIITVIYLPLSLATAIFSMSMWSGASVLYWVYWVAVALLIVALIVFTAFDYKEILSAFQHKAAKP